MSGAIIFMPHEILDTSMDFWHLYAVHTLMRNAVGGRWVLVNLARISYPDPSLLPRGGLILLQALSDPANHDAAYAAS